MVNIPVKPLPKNEFIALVALMTALNAGAIDMMLPAMSEMGQSLTPDAPLRIQLIITAFIFGSGAGMLTLGPVSDALGRRRAVLMSGMIFITGSVVSWWSQTLEALLVARFIQGMGAAGLRIVAQALVRDSFAGRDMARIMSLVLTIFMLLPALAPTVGATILWLGNWRGIFLFLLVLGAGLTLWFLLRQPETLPPEKRRPFNLVRLSEAARELAANRIVRRSVAVQILCMAMMLSTISSVEMIYDQTLGHGHEFHLWFGAAALSSLAAPILNSRLVMRFGMYRIIRVVLALQLLGSASYLISLTTGIIPTGGLAVFFFWQISVFMTLTFCMGNLNAMALQPLGHIAGTASSLIAAFGMIGGATLGAIAAAQFNGTQIPLVSAILIYAVVASLMMMGKTFRAEAERASA